MSVSFVYHTSVHHNLSYLNLKQQLHALIVSIAHKAWRDVLLGSRSKTALSHCITAKPSAMF